MSPPKATKNTRGFLNFAFLWYTSAHRNFIQPSPSSHWACLPVFQSWKITSNECRVSPHKALSISLFLPLRLDLIWIHLIWKAVGNFAPVEPIPTGRKTGHKFVSHITPPWFPWFSLSCFLPCGLFGPCIFSSCAALCLPAAIGRAEEFAVVTPGQADRRPVCCHLSWENRPSAIVLLPASCLLLISWSIAWSLAGHQSLSFLKLLFCWIL